MLLLFGNILLFLGILLIIFDSRQQGRKITRFMLWSRKSFELLTSQRQEQQRQEQQRQEQQRQEQQRQEQQRLHEISRYFYLLDLNPRTATKEDISKAFRRKVLNAHPDVGGSSYDFISLKTAQEICEKYVTERNNI